MITEIGGNWELPLPAGARPAIRPPAACERHPDELVTGFCASCLRERLAGLEAAATNAAEAPRKSTSSAIKSIFSRSSGVQPPGSNTNLQSSSFRRSELRRSKSFSVSRFPCVAAAVEPQRKSCDIRARNTLLALFHQDDVDRPAASLSVSGDVVEECHKFSLSGKEGGEDNSDEIMSAADDMEEDTETAVAEELKSMKDHIDLNSQEKKIPAKEFTGSFWFAASVFSKKLRNWRIQKLQKKSISTMQPEKTGSSSQRIRDTQSEIAIDAFGRCSFDINPRFSLDASRFSFEDPRHSWDEPRASWDGYLVSGGGGGGGGGGGRSILPRLPPMLAVAEDFPAPAVQRFDGLIPVVEDLVMPGGSLQTLDYYEGGSTSRGRRSLERSNSTRKSSFEMKALTPGANAHPKGSISVSAELVQAYHGGKHERDSREWSSNSLRDECSENLDFASRDQSKVPPPAKKSRRWSKAWNLFGFIHWRGRSSSSGSRGNGMERSFSETWPELRTSGYNPRICRSNSAVSSRSLFKGNGERGGSVRTGLQSSKGNRKKKKIMEEFELERNSSSRYLSRGVVDNGLSGLYLPAVKGSRRKTGKYISSHSITGSMLSLY
ncbi:UPF0503 protein [Platanthera zijinensis]|uniref:UPF0503 protein n=1 Tax=Platanthera zijinensis TaxID=2320716 RepID=A0AAP0B424_9ASPA